ncbi:hypothetical protein [Pedobacter sp. GR22-10]|uniref:hypothetical protein n=1 Tax=Pedobacter sp. GR22-10 TaxID=2994472 RepID=UPI0022469F1C|nr:hypothetical protein [Pedobacter sp. GR22-10]MCX2430897.1 hypothetical protein [Pedobacter sp. GR22-10]
MELDDLKQDWNKSTPAHKTPLYNLDELTVTKSTGAIETLKRKYKKQMILLPLAATFLGSFAVQNPVLQRNAFIWFIIPLMLLLALIYYRSYMLVAKMEQTSMESIKKSIQENIELLDRNAKQQLYFTRFILIMLILILEATMYYQHPAAFVAWSSLGLPIRLAAYTLALFLQPFITKYFFELNFGRYIQNLKSLLNQAT